MLERIGFLDETWLKTNMAKRTGWAPRGQRLVDHAPFDHWRTQTFVATLRHDRLVAALPNAYRMVREARQARDGGGVADLDRIADLGGEIVGGPAIEPDLAGGDGGEYPVAPLLVALAQGVHAHAQQAGGHGQRGDENGGARRPQAEVQPARGERQCRDDANTRGFGRGREAQID